MFSWSECRASKVWHIHKHHENADVQMNVQPQKKIL